jgi:hypothetical protein
VDDAAVATLVAVQFGLSPRKAKPQERSRVMSTVAVVMPIHDPIHFEAA